MFAKIPEGFNNPNSPDFPGLNSTGGPNINPYNENQNYYYNNNQVMSNNNNNNTDYPENIPDSNLINKVSQNVGGSWLDTINWKKNLIYMALFGFIQL